MLHVPYICQTCQFFQVPFAPPSSHATLPSTCLNHAPGRTKRPPHVCVRQPKLLLTPTHTNPSSVVWRLGVTNTRITPAAFQRGRAMEPPSVLFQPSRGSTSLRAHLRGFYSIALVCYCCRWDRRVLGCRRRCRRRRWWRRLFFPSQPKRGSG